MPSFTFGYGDGGGGDDAVDVDADIDAPLAEESDGSGGGGGSGGGILDLFAEVESAVSDAASASAVRRRSSAAAVQTTNDSKHKPTVVIPVFESSMTDELPDEVLFGRPVAPGRFRPTDAPPSFTVATTASSTPPLPTAGPATPTSSAPEGRDNDRDSAQQQQQQQQQRNVRSQLPPRGWISPRTRRRQLVSGSGDMPGGVAPAPSPGGVDRKPVSSVSVS